MYQLSLRLERKGRAEKVNFVVKKVFAAGFTGRDQAAVRAHIHELKEKGISAPDVTPTLYPVAPYLLTTANQIEVVGAETSGEAEFVLLLGPKGKVFVAVGSDHTDRELEKTDILKSKQANPKIISKAVWDFAHVKAVWDTILLRSWVWHKGKRERYQEGALSRIMSPGDLLRFVQAQADKGREGTAIFSGTLPTLSGQMVFGNRFEAELMCRLLKMKLRLAYTVVTIPIPSGAK